MITKSTAHFIIYCNIILLFSPFVSFVIAIQVGRLGWVQLFVRLRQAMWLSVKSCYIHTPQSVETWVWHKGVETWVWH